MLSILALCAILAGSHPSAASPTVLWQIGQPANSYRELAIAGDYRSYASRFPRDVEFTVGSSRAQSDWPYIQPGPMDEWAGRRAHPFRIQFHLDRVPAHALRLVIDFANTHYNAPPLLKVDINGRRSYTFQLTAGTGDNSLSDPVAGRPSTVSLVFPGSHLSQGRNQITLTATRGSWLLYDSLRLEVGGDIPSSPNVASLSAESTVLFRRQNGHLRQAVRVHVVNGGPEGPARLSLTGSQPIDRTVTLGPGDNVLDLLVDPYKRPTPSTLTIRCGPQASSVAFVGRPERKWTVYVGPSSHTDIGYTDLQANVFARHNRNTEAALEASATCPGFKWNLEVAFQANLFERTHPAEFSRLMEMAREGRVGVQGSYLNMLTGLCSGEELIECFSRAQMIAQSNGFRVDSANISDVPTTVGTLPMLLSGSGVRYYAEAVNSQRAPLFRGASPAFKQSPFWWEGLDGSRVMALFSEQYAQAGAIGLTANIDELGKRLPGWLKQFDRPDYVPDAVYVYGAFSDNQPLDPAYAQIATEWNREWAYPRIVISRVDEFFRYVEGAAGKRLPVLRGDFGVYWEDGAGSSARETAISRRAKTRLRAAELWSARISQNRTGRAALETRERRAWDDVLFYDEHTWGAWCATSQPKSEQTTKQWEYKAAFATNAAAHAESLYRSALTAVVGRPTPAASGRYVTVPNDQSWRRDVLARIVLPGGSGNLRLRDMDTGRLVTSQRSGTDLLFTAAGVEPLSFRTYRLEKGGNERAAPVLQPTSDPWEWQSADYVIRFSPATGAVTELTDRRRNQNWVDGARGRGLNQFLYVLGGRNSRIVAQDLGEPKLEVLTPSEARLSLVENGPLRAVLRVDEVLSGSLHVESYVILGAAGQIDFVNVVHKPETLDLEAGYFAFPIKMEDRAEAYVELPYGILQTEREQLPGGCREWYAADSFIATSDGRFTAVISGRDAPLFTVGDIFRGQWRKKLDEGSRNELFGYAFNNYWDTNYRAQQGGDMVFSYSLRLSSGPFDPVAATRFGRESLAGMGNPADARSVLHTGEVDAWITAARSNTRMPVVRLTGSSVIVGRVTRRGNALLVRLYNPSSRAARVRVSVPGVRSAHTTETNLVGKPIASRAAGDGAITVRARGVASVLMRE